MIEEQQKYLFNLKEDIGETTDIGTKSASLVEDINKSFLKWKQELPESDCKNSGIANEMQKNYIDNLKNTRK